MPEFPDRGPVFRSPGPAFQEPEAREQPDRSPRTYDARGQQYVNASDATEPMSLVTLRQMTEAIEAGGGGGPGPGSGDANYVHNQSALASTWLVAHNLNKYPSVEVVDTGNTVILPNVHYESANQITLTFSAPTSGKAYVN